MKKTAPQKYLPLKSLLQKHLPRKHLPQKHLLQKCLLLTPVTVLFVTLFFLDYTVRYLKDTACTFVYATNVESVQRFSKELRELSAQGYTRELYSGLYASMIQNYNQTLGEKDAILTFLVDAEGEIHHSSSHNEAYLREMLQDAENSRRIHAAFAEKDSGEITLDNGGAGKVLYYHAFSSGTKDYALFMSIEEQAIQEKLHVHGIIIPIAIIGLLLLFVIEYMIWLQMSHMPAQADPLEEKEGQDADELH